MLPAQRGQVSQQMIGNVLRLTEGGDCAPGASRVSEDDGGDEDVEAGRPVQMVLVSAVADFAEPVDEGRPRQAASASSSG